MNLAKFLTKISLKQFVSGKTLANIGVLMRGTMLSAALPIVFSPLMTRIFSAADYGMLGMYMSISSVIGVIAYSHYSQAVILAAEDEEAKQSAWLTISFSAVVAILFTIILLFLKLFTNLIDNSELRNWFFLMPLSVFLTGFNTTLLIWANRKQRYHTLSGNRLIQAALTIVVQLSLGLLLRNETGLLLGLVVGQLVSVTLLVIRFLGNKQYSIGLPNFKVFRSVAVRHRALFFYSTPSEFINSVINQTPVFLLQQFGGIAYVGNYSFTHRLLGMPQLLISSSISDVFRQKASASFNRDGHCRDVYVKTLKSLSLIGALPFLLLILFAPNLFSFVFGHQWYTAGVFAQLLGIMFYFRFVTHPLTYVYYIAGKQREDFFLHLLFLALTTGSFYFGNYFFEDKKMMLLCYSVTYSFVYIIYLIRSYKFSKGESI